MKKILFTPGIAAIEALGSITRLIAIADEIKKIDKDCNILFRSAGIEADYAASCGYKVVQGYKPKFNIKQFHGKPSIKSSCDVIKLKCLTSKEYVYNTFKEEIELIKKFKPDLIFGEFEMVMPIAAKKMNIPYFSTGGTPNEKNFSGFGFTNKTASGYEENYNELLKSLNLKTIDNICELIQDYNSSKVFIPSIPEMENFKESARNIFLGSILPQNFIKSEFSFQKKRPLIYVYLSVGEIKAEVYQKVLLETFSGSEFDVIVTAGNSHFKDSENNNDDNVHFMSMVPADKVLKMADIAIHHGGQNTTVQCIKNKVPAIIFPGSHFERYFNAEKAAEIGCAVNVKVSSFEKEFLLKTCRKIITDNAVKKNLNKYSEKIVSLGGASKAAEFITEYMPN